MKKNKSKLEINKHLHLFRGSLYVLKAPFLVSGYGNTKSFSPPCVFDVYTHCCAVEIKDLDMRLHGLRYESGSYEKECFHVHI